MTPCTCLRMSRLCQKLSLLGCATWNSSSGVVEVPSATPHKPQGHRPQAAVQERDGRLQQVAAGCSRGTLHHVRPEVGGATCMLTCIARTAQHAMEARASELLQHSAPSGSMGPLAASAASTFLSGPSFKKNS